MDNRNNIIKLSTAIKQAKLSDAQEASNFLHLLVKVSEHQNDELTKLLETTPVTELRIQEISRIIQKEGQSSIFKSSSNAFDIFLRHLKEINAPKNIAADFLGSIAELTRAEDKKTSMDAGAKGRCLSSVDRYIRLPENDYKESFFHEITKSPLLNEVSLKIIHGILDAESVLNLNLSMKLTDAFQARLKEIVSADTKELGDIPDAMKGSSFRQFRRQRSQAPQDTSQPGKDEKTFSPPTSPRKK